MIHLAIEYASNGGWVSGWLDVDLASEIISSYLPQYTLPKIVNQGEQPCPIVDHYHQSSQDHVSPRLITLLQKRFCKTPPRRSPRRAPILARHGKSHDLPRRAFSIYRAGQAIRPATVNPSPVLSPTKPTARPESHLHINT